MKQIRSKLSDKKEKKLKYDYKYIEEITEKFLRDYEIDAKMEIFIQEKIDKEIDLNLAYQNVTSSKKYKSQIDVYFFYSIRDYLENIIQDSISKELEYLKNNGEDEDFINKHKEILENTMEEIKLTMFENGVKRTTLTAYHYFLKVFHKNTEAFIEKNNIKKIKGIKNPNELLAKEIYTIVGNDPEMTRFVLTLKNLTEQWLIKYSTKTKIGEFYYDILMITPEYIVEKILKYLTMVAIKNKNPMTLRAIFSSYITLIHKNIFSYYATNLNKVKVGYFKQLEGLFAENFDLIHDKNNTFDPKKPLFNHMINVYLMKNKRFLNTDIDFLNNEYFQYFFEPNYIDVLSRYNYTTDVNLLDHVYIYNTVYKYTKNNIQGAPKITNAKVINSYFFKKNTKKKNINYIKEKLTSKLYPIFYNIFVDKDTVLDIIEVIAKDILKKINFDFYLDDETLDDLNMTFNEYLESIDYFIDKIEKIILEELS